MDTALAHYDKAIELGVHWTDLNYGDAEAYAARGSDLLLQGRSRPRNQ